MAKYYKYERGISDGVVRDIGTYRFNNGEIVHVGENIVRIDADDEQIAEWVSVQNCNPVELTLEESATAAKAWAKTHGDDYNGHKVPFMNEDALAMLQVKTLFEMGGTSTNIEFSNGTVMPMSSTDFPAFAAWFVEKRNGYFA
jgi:pyruvate/2-oxoglutarate dehydrogenase complex dihydrolipoamide acyltransferase (E2) component